MLSVVQALMTKSDWSASAPLFSRLEVLETLDAQSRVLKGNVLPSGAANAVSLTGPPVVALSSNIPALLSGCYWRKCNCTQQQHMSTDLRLCLTQL